MRFSDGFWLDRKGYEVSFAAQAFEITPIENGFKVLATPFTGRERYKQLGSANLEICYTSDAENVIKVTVTHHKGAVDRSPKFRLNSGSYKPEVIIGEDKAEWNMRAGGSN